eukprot:767137-Hanusia_phi.AAC.27
MAKSSGVSKLAMQGRGLTACWAGEFTAVQDVAQVYTKRFLFIFSDQILIVLLSLFQVLPAGAYAQCSLSFNLAILVRGR